MPIVESELETRLNKRITDLQSAANVLMSQVRRLQVQQTHSAAISALSKQVSNLASITNTFFAGANSIFTPSAVSAGAGTLTGGVTDVATMLDGHVITLTEALGTPGWDIDFTFTALNVTPTHLVVRLYYNGLATSKCGFSFYNYNTSTWDLFHEFTSSLDYQIFYVPLTLDFGNYITGAQTTLLEISNFAAGDGTSQVLIDYVALVCIAVSSTNTIVTSPAPLPVGTAFMASVNTNPAVLLGYGTWAAVDGSPWIVIGTTSLYLWTRTA